LGNLKELVVMADGAAGVEEALVFRGGVALAPPLVGDKRVERQVEQRRAGDAAQVEEPKRHLAAALFVLEEERFD
jgi:hypothetical protein